MESTGLPRNDYQPSREPRLSWFKGINKYLLVVLGVFFVTATVLAFLALKGNKIDKERVVVVSNDNKSESFNDLGSPGDDPSIWGEGRYLEGVRLYEGTGEDRRLLIIRGRVEEIDLNQKTLVVGGTGTKVREKLQYENNDHVQLLELANVEQSANLLEISFSDIQVGDNLTYNPPNAAKGVSSALWIVQR